MSASGTPHGDHVVDHGSVPTERDLETDLVDLAGREGLEEELHRHVHDPLVFGEVDVLAPTQIRVIGGVAAGASLHVIDDEEIEGDAVGASGLGALLQQAQTLSRLLPGQSVGAVPRALDRREQGLGAVEAAVVDGHLDPHPSLTRLEGLHREGRESDRATLVVEGRRLDILQDIGHREQDV